MARVYELMEGKKFEPLITGEPHSSALITVIGECRYDYTDLAFRSPETLVRFIATLVTLDREWAARREAYRAAREFHAEQAEVINVASR